MVGPFGIIEATSAHGRIAALCQFLDFWAGPRRSEFGEPIAELEKFKLPMPLRQLYEFAGRWPHFKFCDSEYFLVPFIGNDRLRRVQFVEYGTDQKIKFMAESQGCWDGCTLTEGEDPPVWKRTFHIRARNDKVFPRDKLISRSLSSFLVTLVLRELVFGSRVSGIVEDLKKQFDDERSDATPIWRDGIYMTEGKNNFYLWGNMLVLEEVCERSPTVVLAANTMDEARFFWTNSHPIWEVIIQDIGEKETDANLVVTLREDGSATASCFSAPYGKVECNRGTINQATLAQLIQATYFATYQMRECYGDPNIRFRAKEGYISSNGCYLPRRIAKDLVERIFANAEDANASLRTLFVNQWTT